MNKTGTSSLHAALLDLGFNSIHHGPPNYQSLSEHTEEAKKIREEINRRKREGEKLLGHIKEYDAFSDIGPIVVNFEILDIQYPNSKFIYTQRDTDDWIASRIKHVERNRKNVARGIYKTNFVNVEESKWRKSKSSHYKRVKQYFSSRSNDILYINICEGEGYEKLCPFLGKDTIDRPFPSKNRIPSTSR